MPTVSRSLRLVQLALQVAKLDVLPMKSFVDNLEYQGREPFGEYGLRATASFILSISMVKPGHIVVTDRNDAQSLLHKLLRMVVLVLVVNPTNAWSQSAVEGNVVLVNMLELPSSRAAQQVLRTPTRIFWEQTPLRTGLQELSQQHGCTIWLDREIDPNQLVTTRAAEPQQDASLHGRLEYIASMAGAEIGLIENVVYFGPPGRAARLQRAAVELHDVLSQSGGQGRGSNPTAAHTRELDWPELATSTELLEQIESAWQIEFDQRLPHDLFHAGRFLRPTTLATQATVILGGFELEAKWQQGNQFRIIPLQSQTRWQANYPKRDVNLRGLVGFLDKFAGGQCQTRGNICHIRGVTNFHLALLATPPVASQPDVSLGSKSMRYEFQVVNTQVSVVLASLAQSIGFELQWDEACSDAQRAQLISFQVKQVTLDQLLAEVARSSGLKIARQKSVVKVGVANER